ncbi:hypothetical protein D3C71_1826530 [compost metagenome]
MHGDAEEQQEFLDECKEKGLFAHKVKFMVRQKPYSMYPRSQDGEVVDKKKYWNGTRPYFSVSTANPDHIGGYCNWTYLESALQKGWMTQFGGDWEGF